MYTSYTPLDEIRMRSSDPWETLSYQSWCGDSIFRNLSESKILLFTSVQQGNAPRGVEKNGRYMTTHTAFLAPPQVLVVRDRKHSVFFRSVAVCVNLVVRVTALLVISSKLL